MNFILQERIKRYIKQWRAPLYVFYFYLVFFLFCFSFVIKVERGGEVYDNNVLYLNCAVKSSMKYTMA